MAQIRYNNPGNIRKGDSWLGSVDNPNSGFVAFKDLAHGLRALFIVLKAKISNGKNTIEKIIASYAPPNENNTENYIKNVSQWTGIDRTAIIDDNTKLKQLVKAITRQEHSVTLSDSEIEEGFKLWQGVKKKELS